nr:MAG TPA: hypothetical protein [Bacteriophage sp.]
MKGLKNGSKVILRKEIVIESVCSDIPFKHYVPEENKYVPEKSRRIIETSESFVGFEDVRLKVEEHMKDEVERSIKQRNEAIARYEEKKAALDKVYEEKHALLEKKYSDISKAAEKKWEDDLNSLERRKNGCMRTIRNVQDLAEKAQKILLNSWIRKKDVEEMMSQIIHSCDESINWHEEA